MKTPWLVKIIHVDLTDVPPARSLVECRTMKLTDKEAAALKKRARRLFRQAGDGNDEYYEFVMTKVDTTKPWSLAEVTKWLDDFKASQLPESEDS